MEILTTDINLPIFFTEKNLFLTKKRNLSLSNQSSTNTSISPINQYQQLEAIKNSNSKNFINLKSMSDQNKKEALIKKGKWSEEEDKLLKKYVHKFGEGNWSKIEKFFIGRTRKQIRQRYISNFKIKKISGEIKEKISIDSYSSSSSDEEENGEIKNEKKIIFKWDEELDKILLKEYFLCKKSWVKISKKIPGSSENSVKNRFYSLLRQKVNKIKKEYKYNYMNKSNSGNCENKNNLIKLIKKEIYGNKTNNNLEDKKELLFNKLYIESEFYNNKSKKRNYSVEILLEFLPELLEEKGIDIFEILDELNQRKNCAAKQIFIIVEKHFDYKNGCSQDCNSISTDIEFDNLKNIQSEKLGIVIKNMKLKIMYKYFHRFRYNTLGI